MTIHVFNLLGEISGNFSLAYDKILSSLTVLCWEKKYGTFISNAVKKPMTILLASFLRKTRCLPFPDWEMPKGKKWLYVDTIDQDSITRMIAFIKEIKSNLKGNFLQAIDK